VAVWCVGDTLPVPKSGTKQLNDIRSILNRGLNETLDFAAESESERFAT
jgi:hypothetical protein